jgi:hypothetical protein
MRTPTPRELWALPELALLPVALATIDALLAALEAQHGTLTDEWQTGDPATLRDARALVLELQRTRGALVRYVRAVRRPLHMPAAVRELLPF